MSNIFRVSSELINSVFNLEYGPKCFSSQADIDAVIAALLGFATSLLQPKQLGKWAQDDGKLPEDFLLAVQKVLGQKMRQGANIVHWMPGFGCAVCFIADKNGLAEHVQVIGMDDWRHVVRPSQGYADDGGVAFVSTAQSQAYKVVYCGEIPEQSSAPEQLEKLEAEIQMRRVAAQQNKNLRSARNEDGGIQNTPGFIAALLSKQLCATSAAQTFSFQGGFTDVGLHTDCTARDTAWKLVCYVLEEMVASAASGKAAMQVARDDAQRFLHLFHVYLLQHQTQLCTEDPSLINSTFSILDKLALDTANRVNHAQPIFADFAVKECTRVRAALNKCVAEQGALQTRQLTVEGADEAALQPPVIEFGTLHSSTVDSDVEKLVKSELASYPLAWLKALRSYGAGNIKEMLMCGKELKSTRRFKGVCSDVFRNELEHCFQRIASEILDLTSTAHVPAENLQHLDELVELYRMELAEYQAKAVGQVKALSVDLKSRETLVVWTLYCVAHKTCWEQSDVFQRYGGSLNAADLAHLNLADNRFRLMLKMVHAYLSQPSLARLAHVPLFGRDDTLTMQFASAFASTQTSLVYLYDDFQQRKNMAIANHWQELERLKRQIEQIEARKRVTAEELREKRAELAQNRRNLQNNQIESRNQSIRALASNILDYESRIDNLDYNPPDAVIVGLPQSQKDAMSIIFFLHMPIEYRLLARSSFLAQQMLVAKDLAKEVKRPTASKLDWGSFVKDAASVKLAGVQQGDLRLVSNQVVAPNIRKNSRPSTVRAHFNETSGVWYPDNFSLETEWSGGRNILLDGLLGSSVAFDPFRATSKSTTVKFTTPSKGLEWAMELDAIGGVLPNRSNIALAEPDHIRPKDVLTREQFKAFASMRAQPLLQYQELCSKLHDGTLPFEQPCVHVLVKQLLGHVGPLHLLDGKHEFLWSWGALREDKLETIFFELSSAASRLKESPSNLGKVLLLGQIASFYSQWDERFAQLAREFARFVESWAVELEQKAAALASSPALLSNLRGRQAIMFGSSLAFYRYLPARVLGLEDVETMCRLFIRFANMCPHIQDPAQLALMCALEFSSREVMAAHRVTVQSAFDGLHGPRIFHGLLTSVVERQLPSAEAFTCTMWNDSAGIFTANMAGFGTAHVDMLFTGKVLVNGRPLTGLPAIVRQHALYIKTFGKRDFDVFTLPNGSSQTTTPVNDAHYSFECIGRRLLVKELGKDGDYKVLLDDEACAQAHALLPPRFLGLCSVWRCCNEAEGDDDSAALTTHVFRGIEFTQRTIEFIHVADHGVYEVPSFRGNEPWFKLVRAGVSKGELRRLHCGSNGVTKALGRFESEQFIHVFVASKHDASGYAEGSIVYHLPRYRMDFVSFADREIGVLPRCETWKDETWSLHSVQCLGDTLLGLNKCIVLASASTAAAGMAKKQRLRIIVPDGKVQRVEGGGGLGVTVSVSSDMGQTLEYFAYDRHIRDGHLVANTLSSRLQLAALYSVCTLGLDLPSQRFGFEIAVELVRQCFPVKFAQPEDLDKLVNISCLSKQRCPALHLLCCLVARWRAELQFLNPTSTDATPFELILDQGAVAMYVQEASRSFGGLAVSRSALLHDYELRSLLGPAMSASVGGGGGQRDGASIRATAREQLVDVTEFCSHATDALDDFVRSADKTLLSLREVDNAHDALATPFPIALEEVVEAVPPFVDKIRRELVDSFDAHSNITKYKVTDVSRVQDIALGLLQDANKHVQRAEKWLEQALWTLVPSDCARNVRIHGLCQANATFRSPTWRDYLLLGFEKDYAKRLNPFLSKSASTQIVRMTRGLLKLFVLQDKLERILRLTTQTAPVMLIKELECERVWDAEEFPTWLAFEAEQGLQVRPDQAHVALNILNKPGEVLQLQVGEGKTRVILPLIVLAKGSKIVRLNFLSGLHGEATSYFANTLSTSILARPVFTMPFCREVVFEGKIGVLEGLLDLVRASHGFLSVCPQHTMSMSLKNEELEGGDLALGSFLKRLAQECVDVFDESDEHLHSRFQLVYAVGDKVGLPDLGARCKAVQSLFLCLQQPSSKELQALLLDEDLVAASNSASTVAVNTYKPVLLKCVVEDAAKAKMKRLVLALAKEVFETYAWIAKLSLEERNALLNLVVSTDQDAKQVLQDMRLPFEFQADILALRGFLGQGLFTFCLTRRPQVHFGIRRPFIPGVNKRVAVPFRANNTPALRAEYSQPECSLLWTYMAYYNDGLSHAEFVQTLNYLLSAGSSAREMEFKHWLDLAPSKEGSMVTETAQIDLSNSIQVHELWQRFGHCMPAINYWLANLVLPQDTSQFPSELVRNAWHVAGDGTGRGISGTNFNHWLLPSQMSQVFHLPQAPTLTATNGKMLHLLMKTAAAVQDAFPAHYRSQTEWSWQCLLKLWYEDAGVDALIDAGALITGVKNADAAAYLISLLKAAPSHRTEKRGVVYFCTDAEDWFVHERASGKRLPLASSSVLAREALVYFDDCRCRGADLKLNPNAVGMVTLSAEMTLSKLIQAAGRLRQLGHDQTVRLVAPQSVIHAMRGNTLQHALYFAFNNTVSEMTNNLVQWCARGEDFYSEVTKRECEISLGAYADAVCNIKLEDYIQRRLTRCSTADEAPRKVLQVLERGMELGQGIFIKSSSKFGGADEECERETELEKEEEEENEVEIPSVCAGAENDWGVEHLMQCGSLQAATSKFGSAHFAGLGDMIKQCKLLSPEVEAIPWPISLCCTRSFIRGVASVNAGLDTYVRMASNLVAFMDGSILLVSEREANALCGAIWCSTGETRAGMQIALLRASFCGEDSLDAARLIFGNKAAVQLSDSSELRQTCLAYLQLFNGDPQIAPARLQVLEPCLRAHGAGIDNIVSTLRNRTAEYRNSTLDRKRVDLQEEALLRRG